MEYHQSIRHLEEEVSYGLLGVLHGIVTSEIQFNLFLVNTETFIRNAWGKDDPPATIRRRFEEEIQVFVEYVTRFCGDAAQIVFYSDLGVRDRIPEASSRELTLPRESVMKMMRQMTEFHSPRGKLEEKGKGVYIYTSRGFAFDELYRVKSKLNKPGYAALVSHCSIDFLLLLNETKTWLLQSHNGEVLNLKQVRDKLFKNERIPFNAVTLILFGDKDYVQPLLQRKKKKDFLENEASRLKTMSTRAIQKLAIEKYGFEEKDFKWLR